MSHPAERPPGATDDSPELRIGALFLYALVGWLAVLALLALRALTGAA